MLPRSQITEEDIDALFDVVGFCQVAFTDRLRLRETPELQPRIRFDIANIKQGSREAFRYILEDPRGHNRIYLSAFCTASEKLSCSAGKAGIACNRDNSMVTNMY